MPTTRTSSRPLRVLVSYFGAKARLGPEIARQLGPHRARFEPFCGGLSVTFACEPSSNEVINDLNGAVVNLAAVIASPRWTDLRDRLDRTHCCEGLLLNSAAWLGVNSPELPKGKRAGSVDPQAVTKEHVEWAYHFAVASWLSRENGLIGARPPRTLARSFTPNSAAKRLPRLVGTLEWMHARLKHVTIWCTDAMSIIERVQDAPTSAIYCDPPYLRATRPSSYLIDVPTDPDEELKWHASLARAVRRFKKARVVVSYYDHPQIRGLYKGWSVVSIKTRRIVGNVDFGKSASSDAPEILLINGDPL